MKYVHALKQKLETKKKEIEEERGKKNKSCNRSFWLKYEQLNTVVCRENKIWTAGLWVATFNTKSVASTNKSILALRLVTSIPLAPSSQTANVIISRLRIYQWHKSYQCLDQSNLSQSHYVCLETTPSFPRFATISHGPTASPPPKDPPLLLVCANCWSH